MPIKPLLAYTIEDTSKIKYPCYVSTKLDGLRAIVEDGVVYSRSGKPFRSKAVQELFGKQKYNGLDGELIYGPANADNVFNVSTQACMSTDLPRGFSKDLLSYHVFDKAVLRDNSRIVIPYHERMQEALADCLDAREHGENVYFVVQTRVEGEQELLALEASMLGNGFEGGMVRSINGPYKRGRSSVKDGIIGKLKRFTDSEAIITGFEELLHNNNEATKDEFGRTERSSHKENLVGAGTLGALLVVDKETGVAFKIGTGFDAATRKLLWEQGGELIGKLAKYKSFKIGEKDAPRFPVFLGLRDEEDMS